MPLPLGRALGCHKDPEDERDYPLTRMTTAQKKKLPKSVDYTSKMSAVSDQGDEGTCVGFATVDGLKEYQEHAEWNKDLQLSVRYVYSNCKKIDDWPDEEGTSIRYALKILQKKGVAPDKCWPYKPHQTDGPCEKADELAKPYRIERYVRLNSLQSMKESLFVNGPFVAGVDVFDSWFQADHDGKVPMPKEGDQLAGGHAICIVGYDDITKEFKFKNSWTAGWGDHGYGYLPYDYILNYCGDAWSAKDLLHKAKKAPKKKPKKKAKPLKKKKGRK
jgi:C1A family cysteine protease